jgi:uncharacterized protein
VSTQPAAGERIAVVDVLRAFALLGIIITHAVGSFLGGPPPAPGYNVFGAADQWVGTLTNLLVFGKFFSIFAFLFGLSFAIQLNSADRKGAAFTARFAWRLLLLLAIGLLHHMFYGGDILLIYALLGFALIPWRRVSTRWLVIVALALVLNLPGLAMNLKQVIGPAPTAEQQQAAAAAREAFQRSARESYEIKRAGTAAELIGINLSPGLQNKLSFQIRSGRLWITFGLFLLGLAAGRLDLFRDTEANRRFFTRLAWAAGGLAAVTTMSVLMFPPAPGVPGVGRALANFASSAQQTSLAAFYLSAVTLLFWRQPTRGVLPALAPMGKMGLTTYLTQSVFGLALFYGIGLGLMGSLGTAWSAALAVGFFVLQVFAARWWLQRFSMGPVEWAWRSATYFRLQPVWRSSAAAEARA